MPRPRHILEYVLLRVMAAAVRCLPYRAALALGWLVAWVAHRLVRFRVAETRARIRQVFGPQFTERDVARVAWESWRNLAFVAIEAARLPRMSAAWMNRVANYQAATDQIRCHIAQGRGAIIATPHMGAWELAGAVGSILGLPLFYLFAEQKNPLFNAYLQRLRTSPGAETVARGGGATKWILRNLREGRLLAIVPDVRARTPGVSVSFLGRSANVAPGMGALARHANVPIFVAVALRRGWARHDFQVRAVVKPDPSIDKDADVLRMTQAVFAVFEQAIREEPGQWFWYNKRWILDPLPGRPAVPERSTSDTQRPTFNASGR